MKRVFAELDDSETNSWGCFCPGCKLYQSFEKPEKAGEQTVCIDCGSSFIVTFYQ